MTIIVYRDGILAADSLVSWGPLRVATTQKIIRRGDGALAGGAGAAGDIASFLAWFFEGGKLDGGWSAANPDEGFAGIVIEADGRVWQYGRDGRPFGTEAPFYALGCAAPVALGALAMGASAKQAVKVCIDLEAYCGGPVQVLRLGPRGRDD